MAKVVRTFGEDPSAFSVKVHQGFLLTLFAFGIALYVCSCDTAVPRGRAHKQIGEYIKNTCGTTPTCKIKLSNALDFGWDRLFVFHKNAESDVISKAIGTSYVEQFPNDYSHKWIFLSGDKIVLSEEHVVPGVDIPVQEGEIIFSFEDCSDFLPDGQNNYLVFNKDDVFQVKGQRVSEKTSYFVLELKTCHSLSQQ